MASKSRAAIMIIVVVSIVVTTTRAQTQVQAQNKSNSQICEEQRSGVTLGCMMQNPAKDFREEIGEPTEEDDKDIETCNHDMLHLLGVCEQKNNEYKFCQGVHSCIDDNNLGQLEERPDQLSQETRSQVAMTGMGMEQ